ncbi:hypothetical protein IWZ00DRAFT_509024 [Phyllosticta capitalensis]
MDTITNLASSASKLIYGDQQDPKQQSGQEPVSGQSGAGTATDPYDSGNLHDDPEKAGKPAQQTNPSSTLDATADNASAEPVVGANLVDRTKDTSGANKTFDAEEGSSAAAPTEGSAQGVNIAGSIHPEHDTEKTGVTSAHTASNEPHGVDIRPSERDADRASDTVGAFGTAVPSVGADPTSGQQPAQKQQGGDRPGEEPSEDQTDAIKDKMDEGEAALAKRDPNDHSGEPLTVHDGPEKTDQENKQDVSGPGGAEESQEKGTGEQYVKSTGFSADGGDFDAAKPGAGKEADRLLDSRGVQRDAGAATSDSNAASPSPARSQESSEHGKTSMKTKIKEKLHIGKHKSSEP